jgi:hypothetical protein
MIRCDSLSVKLLSAVELRLCELAPHAWTAKCKAATGSIKRRVVVPDVADVPVDRPARQQRSRL